MKMYKQHICLLFYFIAVSQAILDEEIGKDLPTNYNNDDILPRRRRPFGGGNGGGGSGCNFNGIRKRPKSVGSGRTFFDLQFVNVGYHENYEINCGGSGHPSGDSGSSGGGGGHKPILGGHGSGGGNHGGILSNKPNRPHLSMILANRPFQGLFSQSQTQTQTAGSQSMAISGPVPPVTSSPPTGVVTPAAPDLVTEPTIDPDDIIYNDDIKPVHEDPDVTGPHTTNKLPPGAYFNRHYAQNRYQSYKNYRDQKINAQTNRNKYHYQQNTPSYGEREPRLRSNLDIYSQEEGRSGEFYRERKGSRGFRFPT